MITGVIGFILGYMFYPAFKTLRVLIIMYQINKTMGEIYEEYDEIRETLNQIDKEWKEKNG